MKEFLQKVWDKEADSWARYPKLMSYAHGLFTGLCVALFCLIRYS